MSNTNLAATLERQEVKPIPLALARSDWASVRAIYGRRPYGTAPLLTAPNANAKISKTTLPAYSCALYAGRRIGYNVCPNAGQCESVCLGFHAGRNVFDDVRSAQAMRTYFLAEHARSFYTIIADELRRAIAKRRRDTGKPGARIACRLNAYSDIAHEKVVPWLFDEFADSVQFYDYTKRDPRVRKPPANYHLTYSADERTTTAQVRDHLNNGRNVAVVGRRRKGEALPVSIYPIIDGDKSDARWTDPRGVIVHLSLKGRAVDRTTPFLRDDLLELGNAVTVLEISPRRAS
tara:strand:- start:272 stop:1144 length:873 start_codon:yes stop_codon:yes gene_type:complete